MTSDPRLESYLTSLEQVLKPFPVSDRAEIVTEIKSHVLSALERDPQARLDTVLAALGEPQTVANRYLIERGLKPTKPPISPMVKWIVIGFLGTFAMILIFAGVVVMRFSPLLHVDDAKDKVSLLGGLIEIDGENGNLHISGSIGEGKYGGKQIFAGSAGIEKGQEVSLAFNNGKIRVSNASDSKFHWDCSGHGPKNGEIRPTSDAKGVSFDLKGLASVKCELELPAGAKISLNGMNGKLELDKPHYNVAAEMTNGKVEIAPDSDAAYRFDLTATNGSVDLFRSSNKADAYSIAVRVVNGKIEERK